MTTRSEIINPLYKILMAVMSLLIFTVHTHANGVDYYINKIGESGPIPPVRRGQPSSPIPGKTENDDPIEILNRWSQHERDYGDKFPPGADKDVDGARKKLTKRIAVCVFKYAENFGRDFGRKRELDLKKLEDLCRKIRDVESDIPYLKKTKLMTFAKEFKEWKNGYKVRVTARVETIKTDPKCDGIKVVYCGMKRVIESRWQESKGEVIPREVFAPNEEVIFRVKCQRINTGLYGVDWWVKDDKEVEREFFYTPGRDEPREETVDFGRGYKIKYSFTVGKMKGFSYPPRLINFLKQHGNNAEELCGEDD